MLTRLVPVICLLVLGIPVAAHAEADLVDLQAITKPGHIDPSNPDQVVLYLKIRNNGPDVAATGNWSWEIKLPRGTQSSMGCTIYTPGTHFACGGDGFHYPVGHALADDSWWIVRVKRVSEPFGNDGFFKLIHVNDPNHSNDVAALTIASRTSPTPAITKSKPTSGSASSAAMVSQASSPTPSPLASASQTPSPTLPPAPAQTDGATGQVTVGHIDSGLTLTTIGVATGGTALFAGVAFFVIRRRRGVTDTEPSP